MQTKKNGRFGCLRAAACLVLIPFEAFAAGLEVSPADPSAWIVDSPSGFRAVFSRAGLEVRGRGWSWTLGLESVVLGGERSELAQVDPEPLGTRIEYRRESIAEWFVHDERGVRHGFTLGARPAGPSGADDLAIELSLGGSLVPELCPDARGLILRDGAGELVLSYLGLQAWDATGRGLSTRMELDGATLYLRVEARDALFPITIDPNIGTEQWEVQPIFAAANTRFGASMAVDGDTVVCGAPDFDGLLGNTDQGGAFVFQFDAATGNWTERSQLTASDPANDDEFGTSVDISGDTIVAGSHLDDDVPSQSGSVYVYVRSGTTWPQQQKITAMDAGNGDQFGRGVAVDGDTLAAGAPFDDDGGTDAGAVYVYVRSGTTWSQQTKIVPGLATNGDRTGMSVALQGDTLVFGAPLANTNGTDSGAAYVYVRTGTVWNIQQRLTAGALGNLSDQMGTSIALHVDRVVTGAPLVNGGALSDVGAIYIFDRTAGVWGAPTQILASDGLALNNFGASVAVWGDNVLVGAPRGEGTSLTNPGAGYRFVRAGTVWQEREKLLASTPNSNALFGASVAADGETFWFGSPANNQSGTNAGAGFGYVCPPPAVYCTGKTTSANCVPFISFSGYPSVTGERFFVDANNLLQGQSGLFLYGFTKGDLDFHGGKLCLKLPFTRLPTLLQITDGIPCVGCTGMCRTIQRNFNKHIQSGLDPMLTLGQRVNMQFRQRDQAASFGDNLTNAVSFVITP